jgi:hypothetical protein
MHRHASMNRVYRLVWNVALGAYIPAAETARGHGKCSKRKLLATVLSLSATIVHAGPTGGQITTGNGSITQAGATAPITRPLITSIVVSG